MLGPDPGQLIAASERGGQRRSCGNWLCGVQPRGRSQRVVSVHQGQLWGKALLHKAPCVSWHANLSSSQGTGVFFFSFFKEQFRIGFFFPLDHCYFPSCSHSSLPNKLQAEEQPGMPPCKPQVQGGRSNKTVGMAYALLGIHLFRSWWKNPIPSLS